MHEHQRRHDDPINARLDELTTTINRIDRRTRTMAVDQATFDAALADLATDLDAGLTAIEAKLAEVAPGVDFSAELATLTDAKTAFDTRVAADTAPPAA